MNAVRWKLAIYIQPCGLNINFEENDKLQQLQTAPGHIHDAAHAVQVNNVGRHYKHYRNVPDVPLDHRRWTDGKLMRYTCTADSQYHVHTATAAAADGDDDTEISKLVLVCIIGKTYKGLSFT